MPFSILIDLRVNRPPHLHSIDRISVVIWHHASCGASLSRLSYSCSPLRWQWSIHRNGRASFSGSPWHLSSYWTVSFASKTHTNSPCTGRNCGILIRLEIYLFGVHWRAHVRLCMHSYRLSMEFNWTCLAESVAGGIYQNSVYGMAAKLPFKYTGAVVLGSNISGTFVSIVSILSSLVTSSDRTAAIYYFIGAMFVLLACFDTYFALPLNVSFA